VIEVCYTSRRMQFILHPLQSLATLLRSLSTGLPPGKLAELDHDFIEMLKEGNMKFYGSADEAMDDILGPDVHTDIHEEVQKTDQDTVLR
jgi:hypothetical protein